MERKILDISKIDLVETGLYGKEYGFYNVLERNGVRTVGQILDEELVARLKMKMHRPSPQQLDAVISLIKYKYYGIMIPNIEKLDYPACKNYNDGITPEIRLVLAFNIEDYGFDTSFWHSTNNLFKTKAVDADIKIIDMIKLAASPNDERVRLYTQAYNEIKKSEIKTADEFKEDIIEKLQRELDELLDERNMIDIKIENIKHRIEMCSKEKNPEKVLKKIL